MKKWRILAVILLVLLLTITGILLGYAVWGRQVVYSEGDEITLYPGFGQKTEYSNSQLLVKPKKEGTPFFVGSAFADTYSSDEFDIILVPAQMRLLYSIGKFAGWENIEGSADKYVLLTTAEKGKIDRYRVAFEESALFGAEMTSLATEDAGLLKEEDGERNITNKTSAKLADLGFDELRRTLKRGDVVIILPAWSIPDLSKKDERGNYLASWLIVRRVDLELEWDRVINLMKGSL